MTRADMAATSMAANQLDEIIVFRSTGPWSLRWLSASPPYPSKNFHVKGKSSDWGPQAGFVPYLGKYSKVGHDEGKAKKGTMANEDGIRSGFAIAIPLTLSLEEINNQHRMKCETPPRTALIEVRRTDRPDVLLLTALRSGDRKNFHFIAVRKNDRYEILIAPEGTIQGNAHMLVNNIDSGKLKLSELDPLLVMASNEVGANQRPMTGDYDLMAICPRWGDYMSTSTRVIEKPAIKLHGGGGHHGAPVGQRFGIGSSMDKVLDMRLHTGAKNDFAKQVNIPVDGRKAALAEHDDMGNLTPRILRAINTLNMNMCAMADSPLRRVHHNAESHRHAQFGALNAHDMETQGDGFPLTAFHPRSAMQGANGLNRYGDVCTIESMAEFRQYAEDVHAAGFFVPKHWAWNMSIRNRGRA